MSKQEPDSSTRDELITWRAAATELESSDPSRVCAPPHEGLADLPGGSALSSLLTVTPFSDYLQHRAHTLYKHSTVQGRVLKYCEDHPKVAMFCTVADLVLRTLVVILILVVVSAIAYKAIAPLPMLP